MRPTPATAVADHKRALDALRAQIRRCRRCPLAAGRTHAVPGAGPDAARVMVVGEAPGRREDESGQPFVGAAGRVFDALLASIGLARGDVYITNVVKCRPFTGSPPGRNRPPRPLEIERCRPWLEEELRLVRPAIVVPMGQVALEAFLPGRRIGEVHGRPHDQDGRIVLPLYHPALARFGAAAQALLRRDIQALARLLRGRRAKRRGRR
jgi:uracil-DNA glycosylase family 4